MVFQIKPGIYLALNDVSNRVSNLRLYDLRGSDYVNIIIKFPHFFLNYLSLTSNDKK